MKDQVELLLARVESHLAREYPSLFASIAVDHSTYYGSISISGINTIFPAVSLNVPTLSDDGELLVDEAFDTIKRECKAFRKLMPDYRKTMDLEEFKEEFEKAVSLNSKELWSFKLVFEFNDDSVSVDSTARTPHRKIGTFPLKENGGFVSSDGLMKLISKKVFSLV